MGHKVLFAQQKGGAGKTMLLTQIAAALAASGQAVTIVDLDPQGTATQWCKERDRLNPDLPPIALQESANWRAGMDIQNAADASDWALIDSPGTADVLKRVLIRNADFCVIPCQPSAADVWACRATLETIEEVGVNHLVVLNRVPPRSRSADIASAELAALGAPVMEATLGARTAFADTFMAGTGAGERKARTKAAEEIRDVLASLQKAVSD
ncbi:MAG: AAA family ATPase [Pseudomonadota bacterium]